MTVLMTRSSAPMFFVIGVRSVSERWLNFYECDRGTRTFPPPPEPFPQNLHQRSTDRWRGAGSLRLDTRQAGGGEGGVQARKVFAEDGFPAREGFGEHV